MSSTDGLQFKLTTAHNRIVETLEIGRNALIDSEQIYIFMARITVIDSVYQEFCETHQKLGTKVSDIDSHNQLRVKTDDAYFEIISIKQRLSSKSESDITDSGSSKRKNCNIRFPKINLPVWDGEFKTWTPFLDMFNTLIHNNSDLANIEKFQYLISSIKGDPNKLLTGFPITEENYILAYKTLLDTYNNNRKLAFIFFEEIRSVSIKNSSPKELRNLLNIFRENISLLKNFKLPVDSWDYILFHLLLIKLDTDIREKFETQLNCPNDIPSFDKLFSFLEHHCQALELSQMSIQPKTNKIIDRPKNKFSHSSFVLNNTSKHCSFCGSSHYSNECDSFVNKNPHERYNLVRDKKLCINCLKPYHGVINCKSPMRCKTCKSKHHSMLHFESRSALPVENVAQTVIANDHFVNNAQQSSLQTISSVATTGTLSLLPTVEVEIQDASGKYQRVRALLDSCSQPNLITNSCRQRLGLQVQKSTTSVHGVGLVATSISNSTSCLIRPVGQPANTFSFNAYIISKICGHMPPIKITADLWRHVDNVNWADSKFNIPGEIDLLLGAEMFALVIKPGRIVGNANEPVALNTIFGWTFLGRVSFPQISSFLVNETILHLTLDSFLEESVKRFWEIESLPKSETIRLSNSEQLCEQLFIDSYSRQNSGRFIVSLPFAAPEPKFVGSREVALKRFIYLESKLIKNDELYKSYREFMQDYIDSGHMSLGQIDNKSQNDSYYIPHHAVHRPDSVSTKLRVVFDASCKDKLGNSINDHLLVGPKLLRDILPILLRFRLHAIVVTCDIRQMYRQILINSSHRKYQKILWRNSIDEPIHEYFLNTVTYGMSSSPYLAIRTLLELAKLYKYEFPLAAVALEQNTFMDDIIHGDSDIETVLKLQSELINILSKGQMELRKWASNSSQVLTNLETSHVHPHSVSFEENEKTPIKILGLEWIPSTDDFHFHVQPLDRTCTKRILLSELARIYDPLGFLTPLTFFAKHLIQKLWTLGLGWDDEVPSDIKLVWSKYRTSLLSLAQISIPRRVVSTNMQSLQLHGFCDASEKGYAAVIYFRIVDNDSNIYTHFVCARSRVAPLKKISIPRLELCAATLLAEVIDFVVNTCSSYVNFDKIYAWSDSTITLSWIKSCPSKWKTYVANRTSFIQDKVDPSCWYHVTSDYNPADCASRGLMPDQLVVNTQWWAGPSWLLLDQNQWPSCGNLNEGLQELQKEERKVTSNVSSLLTNLDLDNFLNKYSSLPKIQRIVAYSLRFVNNIRNNNSKRIGALTQLELHDALLVLVYIVQRQCFTLELKLLGESKLLSKQFRKLNPFLDNKGILRVGGRLLESNIDFEHKHQAILPRKHRLTELLILDSHHRYLHPGAQTLHFLLRQNFWILSAKRAINSVISGCIKCYRIKPKCTEPYMGNLPSYRIQQIKAFSIVSVDMGGPFLTANRRGRGAKYNKSYICIFVCCSTKAIHIELVTDMTSDAFIAALQRFIARRGRCIEIHSDCGSNFIGAARQLKNLMKAAADSEYIIFKFNPPYAPHFGGLHEAGIKSVKSHIYKSIGNQKLTFEEMYTLLTKIEAILNSRPLYSVSSDPNDLSVLTPGHFLTLAPLTSVPEPDFSDVNINRLNRWQLLQALHQSFWRRWSNEYLHNLQQRLKWNKNSEILNLDDLVLVKDENTSPLSWLLARIVKLHYGRDGVARVATIKTANGTLQRPIVKLCPLPIKDN